MRIKTIVESLCSRYGTRDPYDLAEYKKAIVLFEPLGGIKGYYNRFSRQRMIHINRDLPVEEQKFTCAHELGHMLLHSNSNTPFLRVNTLYSIGKFENEANRFAVDLLYSDDDLQDYLSFSVPEIAACFNVSEELIAYRLSVIKEKRRDE